MRSTGAQIVWEMLSHENVEVVFGIPGGAIMHTYHPRQDYGIRHVLMRHEQAAAHAADGYARVSGKVGVAIATSGPGATNLVTGIATAMIDSVPIVCITGQVPTALIGSDAFQETDITGVTLPITKHNYLVTDVGELADVIHEAFYVARTGRPGPVLIDLPKDVQQAEGDFRPPDGEVRLSGYRPKGQGDPTLVQRAAMMVNDAERPVVLAGHGVAMAGATDVLREFVERTNTPVALTLLAKGGFPESHPLALGMMGMHGASHVNRAIQEADLLLAFGMRFDDRVTGTLETYAPRAKKVHVDLDPAELNKIVPVDVAIEGDLAQVLRRMLPMVEARKRSSWLGQVERWRGDSKVRDVLNRAQNGRLLAPQVVDAIYRGTSGEAILVTDENTIISTGVGQPQMWAAQYYPLDIPCRLVTSGGLGTMGFGLPAAIGAQVAQPESEVWAIVGDGGFQMTLQELATAVQERLPIRIAICNNGYLGMVRQWQEFFYDERYESTRLLNPDFVKLAEAYGVRGLRVTRPDEVELAVTEARAYEGPILIEFQVAQDGDDGNVYPMVPSGAALHEMIRRPAVVGEAT